MQFQFEYFMSYLCAFVLEVARHCADITMIVVDGRMPFRCAFVGFFGLFRMSQLRNGSERDGQRTSRFNEFHLRNPHRKYIALSIDVMT